MGIKYIPRDVLVPIFATVSRRQNFKETEFAMYVENKSCLELKNQWFF